MIIVSKKDVPLRRKMISDLVVNLHDDDKFFVVKDRNTGYVGHIETDDMKEKIKDAIRRMKGTAP